jgi:hypothetical protein
MKLSPYYKEKRGYLGEVTLPPGSGEYAKEAYITKAVVYLRGQSSILLVVADADVEDFIGEVIYLPRPTPETGMSLLVCGLPIKNQDQLIAEITKLLPSQNV